MPNEPHYYSSQEVADIVGIHRSNVHYHTQRLGLGRRVGRAILYTDKDIRAIKLHTKGKDNSS